MDILKGFAFQECGNSAVLGSAYLAKLSLEPDLTFQDIIDQLQEPILACSPNKDAVQVRLCDRQVNPIKCNM